MKHEWGLIEGAALRVHKCKYFVVSLVLSFACNFFYFSFGCKDRTESSPGLITIDFFGILTALLRLANNVATSLVADSLRFVGMFDFPTERGLLNFSSEKLMDVVCG